MRRLPWSEHNKRWCIWISHKWAFHKFFIHFKTLCFLLFACLCAAGSVAAASIQLPLFHFRKPRPTRVTSAARFSCLFRFLMLRSSSFMHLYRWPICYQFKSLTVWDRQRAAHSIWQLKEKWRTISFQLVFFSLLDIIKHSCAYSKLTSETLL